MTYEITTITDFDGSETEMLKRDNADGTTTWVPMVETNSDYQAYLNPDKVEHLTEIVPADEPAAKS